MFPLFFRKPYTPDVFNDLSPYYNKFIVDYMINDQVNLYPCQSDASMEWRLTNLYLMLVLVCL